MRTLFWEGVGSETSLSNTKRDGLSKAVTEKMLHSCSTSIVNKSSQIFPATVEQRKKPMLSKGASLGLILSANYKVPWRLSIPFIKKH